MKLSPWEGCNEVMKSRRLEQLEKSNLMETEVKGERITSHAVEEGMMMVMVLVVLVVETEYRMKHGRMYNLEPALICLSSIYCFFFAYNKIKMVGLSNFFKT